MVVGTVGQSIGVRLQMNTPIFCVLYDRTDPLLLLATKVHTYLCTLVAKSSNVSKYVDSQDGRRSNIEGFNAIGYWIDKNNGHAILLLVF